MFMCCDPVCPVSVWLVQDCGGIRASMGKGDMGLIDGWLRGLKDIARLHKEEVRYGPAFPCAPVSLVYEPLFRVLEHM
jgi:hypothetical protein